MTHKIVWTWSRGGVDATAVCDDEDCLNAYECDYPCETYPDLRRDPDGTVSHGGYDDTAATPRHVMHRSGECNLELFLNAERGLLPELNEDGHPDFVIAETVIEPVWLGEDGALWRLPSPAEFPEVAA